MLEFKPSRMPGLLVLLTIYLGCILYIFTLLEISLEWLAHKNWRGPRLGRRLLGNWPWPVCISLILIAGACQLIGGIFHTKDHNAVRTLANNHLPVQISLHKAWQDWLARNLKRDNVNLSLQGRLVQRRTTIVKNVSYFLFLYQVQVAVSGQPIGQIRSLHA